jgi:predicted small lipoprotein YifL
MINMHRILGARHALSRPLVAAALLGAGLLLTACGQKGPLYMPTPTAKAVPVAQPAPDDTAAKDKLAK